MNAVCTTLGCWAAAAAPTAGLGGLVALPASEPLVLPGARSPSGLLWTGIPPAVPDAGGVISMGPAEGWTDDERSGRLRVLPGASGAPAKLFLEEGGSARPLISRDKSRSRS